MAEGPDLLGNVLADASRPDGVGLREILELSIRAALNDEESLALLGPEALQNALNALSGTPADTDTPEPGWRVAEGIAARRARRSRACTVRRLGHRQDHSRQSDCRQADTATSADPLRGGLV